MTCHQDNTLASKLFAAEARFSKATNAYTSRIARALLFLHGSPDGEEDWHESIEVDDASDARWAIEDRALASGDPALIAIATERRKRDGVQVTLCAAA